MCLAKPALAVVNLSVSRREVGGSHIRRRLPNCHPRSWLEQQLPISLYFVDSHLSGRRCWAQTEGTYSIVSVEVG